MKLLSSYLPAQSVHILINRTKYDRIAPYSEYGKEDNRARYGTEGGILHARTGCEDIATQARQHNQDDPARDNAWVQNRGSLAYQQRRICTVLEDSEGCLYRQGKLTPLPVAHLLLSELEPPMQQAVKCYLVVYYTRMRGKSQQTTTNRTRDGSRQGWLEGCPPMNAHGNGVAAGEVSHAN